MQLSCLPVSFFPDIVAGRMTVRDWARMGRDLGLDAIDVSILFFPDRSASALAAARQAIEAEGMQITMMSTYPDFTHPDAAQRQRELEQEVAVVELAAALGVKLVRVTAGQAHPETGIEEGIGWAVEGIRALLERTANFGPQLVYENHGKPGVWQYTDFSTPGEIFLSIFRATADLGLGINYDTANATAFTPDPRAILAEVIGRVVSVHAADTAVLGALRGVVIGQGLVPFADLFAMLQQAGWDNWICIEEASNTGKEGVAAAAQFVRQTWQHTQERMSSRQ